MRLKWGALPPGDLILGAGMARERAVLRLLATPCGRIQIGTGATVLVMLRLEVPR